MRSKFNQKSVTFVPTGFSFTITTVTSATHSSKSLTTTSSDLTSLLSTNKLNNTTESGDGLKKTFIKSKFSSKVCFNTCKTLIYYSSGPLRRRRLKTTTLTISPTTKSEELNSSKTSSTATSTTLNFTKELSTTSSPLSDNKNVTHIKINSTEAIKFTSTLISINENFTKERLTTPSSSSDTKSSTPIQSTKSESIKTTSTPSLTTDNSFQGKTKTSKPVTGIGNEFQRSTNGSEKTTITPVLTTDDDIGDKLKTIMFLSDSINVTQLKTSSTESPKNSFSSSQTEEKTDTISKISQNSTDIPKTTESINDNQSNDTNEEEINACFEESAGNTTTELNNISIPTTDSNNKTVNETEELEDLTENEKLINDKHSLADNETCVGYNLTDSIIGNDTECEHHSGESSGNHIPIESHPSNDHLSLNLEEHDLIEQLSEELSNPNSMEEQIGDHHLVPHLEEHHYDHIGEHAEHHNEGKHIEHHSEGEHNDNHVEQHVEHHVGQHYREREHNENHVEHQVGQHHREGEHNNYHVGQHVEHVDSQCLIYAKPDIHYLLDKLKHYSDDEYYKEAVDRFISDVQNLTLITEHNSNSTNDSLTNEELEHKESLHNISSEGVGSHSAVPELHLDTGEHPVLDMPLAVTESPADHHLTDASHEIHETADNSIDSKHIESDHKVEDQHIQSSEHEHNPNSIQEIIPAHDLHEIPGHDHYLQPVLHTISAHYIPHPQEPHYTEPHVSELIESKKRMSGLNVYSPHQFKSISALNSKITKIFVPKYKIISNIPQKKVLTNYLQFPQTIQTKYPSIPQQIPRDTYLTPNRQISKRPLGIKQFIPKIPQFLQRKLPQHLQSIRQKLLPKIYRPLTRFSPQRVGQQIMPQINPKPYLPQPKVLSIQQRITPAPNQQSLQQQQIQMKVNQNIPSQNQFINRNQNLLQNHLYKQRIISKKNQLLRQRKTPIQVIPKYKKPLNNVVLKPKLKKIIKPKLDYLNKIRSQKFNRPQLYPNSNPIANQNILQPQQPYGLYNSNALTRQPMTRIRNNLPYIHSPQNYLNQQLDNFPFIQKPLLPPYTRPNLRQKMPSIYSRSAYPDYNYLLNNYYQNNNQNFNNH